MAGSHGLRTSSIFSAHRAGRPDTSFLRNNGAIVSTNFMNALI
jgi:hypothetical protein